MTRFEHASAAAGTIATDEELAARRNATGRQCGACTMCCHILGVHEPPALTKPPDSWCKHCKPGEGGMIYEQRPRLCRRFHCQWLLDPSLDEAWYPLTSKIVINPVCNEDGSNPCLVFEVDPRRPDRWLQHPYFDRISNLALVHRGTTVRVGKHWYVLAPRQVAESPSGVGSRMGADVTGFVPGRVGPKSFKSPFGEFRWIEVVPTAKFLGGFG